MPFFVFFLFVLVKSGRNFFLKYNLKRNCNSDSNKKVLSRKQAVVQK